MDYYGRIYSSELSRIKGKSKSILLILFYLKIKAGARDCVFVKQKDIAKDLGISFSSVQKGIYALQECNILHVVVQGKKLPNKYVFNAPLDGDTHCTMSTTMQSDTQNTAGLGDGDTHCTMSIHKERIKDKDNIYNYIYELSVHLQLFVVINKRWSWNYPLAKYQVLIDKYPQINHQLELMIVDAWLHKKQVLKEKVWNASYVEKGLTYWFINLMKSDYPYRKKIPQSLARFARAFTPFKRPPTQDELQQLAELRERIEQKEQKQKEHQDFLQEQEQIIQSNTKRERIEVLPLQHPLHQAALQSASPELQTIMQKLAIHKSNLFTSYRLKRSKYRDLQLNSVDTAYILQNLHLQAFLHLQQVFSLEAPINKEIS